ncbi:unnamed protein product, partial [Polarella glacialis]
YATCWASTLFGLYVLLELEVVSWKDSLRPLFEGLGLEAYTERIDPCYGNFVIAFMVNELLEPIRFPLVLATGPPLIKMFGRFRAESAAKAAAAAATAAASAAATKA